MAGGQGLPAPPPPGPAPGCRWWAARWGDQIARRALLCAKSQTSAAPVQQLAKIIIVSNNIFNS